MHLPWQRECKSVLFKSSALLISTAFSFSHKDWSKPRASMLAAPCLSCIEVQDLVHHQERSQTLNLDVGTFWIFFFFLRLTVRYLTMQLCECCNKNPFKYKCPRCAFKSCSLDCSKTHKIKTGCSGERSKTHYVPLKQYAYNDMISGKFTTAVDLLITWLY